MLCLFQRKTTCQRYLPIVHRRKWFPYRNRTWVAAPVAGQIAFALRPYPARYIHVVYYGCSSPLRQVRSALLPMSRLVRILPQQINPFGQTGFWQHFPLRYNLRQTPFCPVSETLVPQKEVPTAPGRVRLFPATVHPALPEHPVGWLPISWISFPARRSSPRFLAAYPSIRGYAQ